MKSIDDATSITYFLINGEDNHIDNQPNQTRSIVPHNKRYKTFMMRCWVLNYSEYLTLSVIVLIRQEFHVLSQFR